MIPMLSFRFINIIININNDIIIPITLFPHLLNLIFIANTPKYYILNFILMWGIPASSYSSEASLNPTFLYSFFI